MSLRVLLDAGISSCPVERPLALFIDDGWHSPCLLLREQSRTWALGATRCQGYSATAALPARCGTAGPAWGERGPLGCWKAYREQGKAQRKVGWRTCPHAGQHGALHPSLSPGNNRHIWCIQWTNQICWRSHTSNGQKLVSQSGKCTYSQGGFGLADGHTSNHHLNPHLAIAGTVGTVSPTRSLAGKTQHHSTPSSLLNFVNTKTCCFEGEKQSENAQILQRPHFFLVLKSSVKRGI